MISTNYPHEVHDRSNNLCKARILLITLYMDKIKKEFNKSELTLLSKQKLNIEFKLP